MMLSWENTSAEIEARRPELAILPVGSTEQHGAHLPVGQDWMAVAEAARAVARELDALLLPPITYGNSVEHVGFAGTFFVSSETLSRTIREIVDCCARQGIRYVAVMNGHGGNWVLKPTVREINLTRSDIAVIWTGPEVLMRGAGEASELHSGKGETSRALHLFPEFVRMERARAEEVDEPKEYLDYVGMKGVTESGVWGDPSGASAEEGKEGFEAGVRRAAEYIREAIAYIERTREPE